MSELYSKTAGGCCVTAFICVPCQSRACISKGVSEFFFSGGCGGGVVVSCARGQHCFSSGLLQVHHTFRKNSFFFAPNHFSFCFQWRMLRPHAYLSRNGDGNGGNDNGGDGSDAAVAPSSPLHLSCLMHDLPNPPVHKTRGDGDTVHVIPHLFSVSIFIFFRLHHLCLSD